MLALTPGDGWLSSGWRAMLVSVYRGLLTRESLCRRPDGRIAAELFIDRWDIETIRRRTRETEPSSPDSAERE